MGVTWSGAKQRHLGRKGARQSRDRQGLFAQELLLPIGKLKLTNSGPLANQGLLLANAGDTVIMPETSKELTTTPRDQRRRYCP